MLCSAIRETGPLGCLSVKWQSFWLTRATTDGSARRGCFVLHGTSGQVTDCQVTSGQVQIRTYDSLKYRKQGCGRSPSALLRVGRHLLVLIIAPFRVRINDISEPLVPSLEFDRPGLLHGHGGLDPLEQPRPLRLLHSMHTLARRVAVYRTVMFAREIQLALTLQDDLFLVRGLGQPALEELDVVAVALS